MYSNEHDKRIRQILCGMESEVETVEWREQNKDDTATR